MSSKVKIIATVFIIWITLYSFKDIENIIAGMLILTVGLVHGACDITLTLTKLDTSLLKHRLIIILLYVAVAILSFTVIYNLPIIGFIVFLCISSYHFGEQHFHKKIINSNLGFFHFLIYGMVVFLLMIIANKESVNDILLTLIGNEIIKLPIQPILYVISGIMLFLWALDFKNLQFSVFKELFNLLIIYVLFYNTNLIVSFASYFVIWHSIPSIYDQIEYLYNNVTKETILKYLKNSGAYWVISITGLIFMVLKGEIVGENYYRILYSFIVSVTIPHILLMNKILSKSS